MAIADTLLSQGYVPAGVKPKVVLEQGGEPVYAGTSAGEKLARSFKKAMEQQEELRKRRDEELKLLEKQSDHYNTLRELGYSPKAALEAVRKGKFPTEVPSEKGLKEQTAEAELDKIQAETDKILREAGEKAMSYDRLKAKILNKIAKDEELTAGEEKVYDEVIKKEQGSTAEFLNQERDRKRENKKAREDLLDEDDEKGNQKIKVTAPDGTKGFMKLRDFEKARAAGQDYKRR